MVSFYRIYVQYNKAAGIIRLNIVKIIILLHLLSIHVIAILLYSHILLYELTKLCFVLFPYHNKRPISRPLFFFFGLQILTLIKTYYIVLQKRNCFSVKEINILLQNMNSCFDNIFNKLVTRQLLVSGSNVPKLILTDIINNY